VATFDGLKTVEAVPEDMLGCVQAEIGDCLDICQVINPLPLLFKSLLPGQEDCVFFSGHLNTRTCLYVLLR
jgi:hypothetical protein